jgi:hypothetical protein
MAAKANIILDQGTTFTTYLALTDTDGSVLDLTGYTARGQIRKWYTSNSYTTFTITITQPTDGYINLSLTANTTANMEPGRYVYDIEAVSGANVITRVIEGIVTVTPEVTKA